jgi:hypothetical protein
VPDAEGAALADPEAAALVAVDGGGCERADSAPSATTPAARRPIEEGRSLEERGMAISSTLSSERLQISH